MGDIRSLAQASPGEEQERLLGQGIEWEMVDRRENGKDQVTMDGDHARRPDGPYPSDGDGVQEYEQEAPVYRVYKRRWFGLMQLVLMNIIVSWDVSLYSSLKRPSSWLTRDTQWLSFSPVANTAAEYFNTTSSIINWLSTAFLFAFVVAAPFTIYALHRGGPRLALITSSLLILFGNWIRYAGTRASPPRFGVTMFGQILIGLAQPFVLSAPTHYSAL
ncbi:MAG: hypothetical protein Q9174_007215, partial [Haloplaca sp. 1 TL-2023]